MTLTATAILCKKISDSWIFLNQKTAPIWFFTALWDRFFLTEIRVTAHLCIKIFGTPNCVIHLMFPHELFGYCETKHFNKTVMTLPLCENFGCQNSFEKSNGSHTIFFRPLRQNVLTEQWCPPPLIESFWYQVRFRNTERFAYEFFRHCETKKIDRKSWCRSPFSAIHSFISKPESFWNNEGFPNEIFQCCETKFFRKNCDTPSYASNFAVSVFFEMQKGSPTSFLGVMWHKEFLDRTVMSSPPHSRPPVNDNFRHEKFFEVQMCSPTKFIVSVK